MSDAISSGDWRSSAMTATPRSIRSAPFAYAASVSRPFAPGWSFDHIEL
jgi:hypothetical protein